jgi:hypothetical protein
VEEERSMYVPSRGVRIRIHLLGVRIGIVVEGVPAVESNKREGEVVVEEGNMSFLDILGLPNPRTLLDCDDDDGEDGDDDVPLLRRGTPCSPENG